MLNKIKSGFIIKNFKKVNSEFKENFIKENGVNDSNKEKLNKAENETKNFNEPPIYYYESEGNYIFTNAIEALQEMKRLDHSYYQIFPIAILLLNFLSFGINNYILLFSLLISLIMAISIYKSGSPNKHYIDLIMNSEEYINQIKNEKIKIRI